MVDVGGNDGASVRHFVAHEFRRDVFGNLRAERLAAMLKLQMRAIFAMGCAGAFAAEVLANCDELHFRCDNPFTRVMQLRDRAAVGRLPRFAPDARKQLQTMPSLTLVGVPGTQKTIIFRAHASAFVFDAVAALEHPGLPQRRQSHVHVAFDFRIAPRALRIVDAERRVVVQRDFTEWNSHRPVIGSVDVGACARGK